MISLSISPLRRPQWDVCTLHRCWHTAYRSTWCTRACRPFSHTSCRAGCHGSSSSQSGQSWWRWGSSWDLKKNAGDLLDISISSMDVSFGHQMGTVLPFSSLWCLIQCKFSRMILFVIKLLFHWDDNRRKKWRTRRKATSRSAKIFYTKSHVISVIRPCGISVILTSS